MDSINFTPALCEAIANADAPTVSAASLINGDTPEVIAVKLARVLLAQNPALGEPESVKADEPAQSQAQKPGILGKFFGN